MSVQQEETIVAVATPQGLGAISVIRLSGARTFDIVSKVFAGKDLKQQASHSILFGSIRDGEYLVDEVLVSVFRSPRTYTGEDLIEISCHASPFIQHKIIGLLQQQGARLALPGEFTQRAFLNGKLDLAQAEAVADLIASENAASHKVALNQLRGGISTELQDMRRHLIRLISLMELELDFSEEDVEFANRQELSDLLNALILRTHKMISSFEYGNAIKHGVPVAIIGKPNAGKSTLLNTLLQEERAIVSDIAGTTRDTIEETLTIDGIRFRFIDTAGLRETADQIEAIGVERARKKVAQAKVLLYLYNFEDDAEEIIRNVRSLSHPELVTILVRNKVDLEGGYHPNDLDEQLKKSLLTDEGAKQIVALSAKEESSVAQLKQLLADDFKAVHDENAVVVTNQRHVAALKNALDELLQTQEQLEMNLTNDLLSFHLRSVAKYLGSITGDIEIDRDILGTIFGEFCIGK